MKGLLLILLWSIVLGLAVTGHNDDGGWSRPRYLGDGWFPDIVADVTGQVHVVWVSGCTGPETRLKYDLVVYSTSSDGVYWAPANDIIACPQIGGAEATRPSLLADASGWLHLLFRDVAVHYAKAPLTQAAQPSVWQAEAIHAGYYSSLIADHRGGLHLVYSSNVPTRSCPICYHIFYQFRTSSGASWHDAIDVSRLSTGSAKPQLQINGEDELFLVWESGEGGAQGQLFDPTTVMFNTSRDGGETWATPSQLSPLEHLARHPGLGQDGQSNLVVVWLDTRTDLVYYRVSSDRGRNWTLATPVPDVYGGWHIYPSRLDHYVMATDSLGHVHLMMVGRSSLQATSLSLFHLIWDGKVWSPPEQIISYKGDVPEWPEVTVALGNQLHLVWFVRPEAYIWSGGQNSQVWYAQKQLDAPLVAPIPLSPVTFTSTLTACTTPIHAPVDPSIAVPTSELPPDWEGNATSETPQALFVLQSIGPAFILILVVILVARRAYHQP